MKTVARSAGFSKEAPHGFLADGPIVNGPAAWIKKIPEGSIDIANGAGRAERKEAGLRSWLNVETEEGIRTGDSLTAKAVGTGNTEWSSITP